MHGVDVGSMQIHTAPTRYYHMVPLATTRASMMSAVYVSQMHNSAELGPVSIIRLRFISRNVKIPGITREEINMLWKVERHRQSLFQPNVQNLRGKRLQVDDETLEMNDEGVEVEVYMFNVLVWL